ncbi:MAG: hypothetical protein ACYC9D_09290 [Candidatus Dormibacteria bacterium]
MNAPAIVTVVVNCPITALVVMMSMLTAITAPFNKLTTGVVTEIDLSFVTVRFVPATPPKNTPVRLLPRPAFWNPPVLVVMVTTVPPATEPVLGAAAKVPPGACT